MNTSNGALDYYATLNDERFQAALKRIDSQVQLTTNNIGRETDKIDSMFRKLGVSIGAFFTVQAAKSFVSELVNVRGEFQQIENALETILRSKADADKVMAQAKDLTLRSPFRLSEIAAAAKQLAAYGIEADKLIPQMEMLANVASGVSAPLGDIAYLYGTLKTQGRAYTRDILQFTNRGIPIINELAKVYGVATDQVQALVEAGKVGFPEIQKAFEDMTSSTGQFYNLIGKQAETLPGQINRLKHEWELMLNEIGTKSEGVLSKGIELTAELIENYKPILETLSTIVLTYGAYKAALVAVNAIEAQGNILHAIGAVRVKALAVQQEYLNKTISVNPWALLIAGLTALGSAIYYQNKNVEDAISLQKEYNDRLLDSEKSIAAEKAKIESLLETAENEKVSREQRLEALKQLNQISPQYFGQLTLEKNGLLSAKEASDKYTASLYAQAQMKAKLSQIEANAKRRTEIQSKIDNNDFGFFEYATKAKTWFGGFSDYSNHEQRQALAAQDELDTLDKQDAELRKSLQEQYEKILPQTEKELINWVNAKQAQQAKVGRFSKKYKELQKQINEGLKKLADGDFTASPDLSAGAVKNKAYWEGQLKDAQDQYNALDEIGKKSEAGLKLLAKAQNAQAKIAGYRITPPKVEIADTKKFADQKKAILEEINNIQQEYLTKSMSQDDQEVMAVKLKFAKIIKEIQDYNRQVPEGKQIGSEVIGRVKNIAQNVVGDIKYGQETDQLKTELEKRKDLYQQYEDWKDEFGKASADKEFGADLDNYKAGLDAEIRALESSEDYKNNYLKQARVKMLKGIQTAQTQIEADAARQTLENALKATNDTEEKILAIKKKYQKQTDALKANGSLTPERQASIDKNTKTEIDQVYTDLLSEQDKIASAADSIAGVTKDQIRAQITSLQTYLATATTLTEQQKERLQEIIQSLSMKMTTATDSQGQPNTGITGLSQLQDLDNQLKKTRNDIIDLTGKINKLKVNGVIPPEAADTAALLQANIEACNKSITELSRQKITALMAGFNGLLDTVHEIGTEFEGIDGNIAQVIETIASLGSGAVNSFGGILNAVNGFKDIQKGGGLAGIFQAGAADGGGLFGGITSVLGKAGPIAMGIGAAVKGITSIFAMGKKVKEENAKARAEIKEWYADAERGEMEYQATLRKRALDNVKRGKTTYGGLIAELDEAKKQFPEVQKAYDTLFQKLQGEEYVSGKGYKHGTLFRKTKTWDIMSSLYGDNYDELEEKYSKGMLKDGAKKDFEELQKLRQELDDLGVTADDVKQQLGQMLTGLDVDSFTDKIFDVIKVGSTAFSQLGTTIEDIIRNAVLNGFKLQVLQPLIQPMLDDLAQHLMDGTATEQYLENWKQNTLGKVQSSLPTLDSTLERLNKSFPGSDGGSTQQPGLSGQIKGVTQDTANELAGLYRNQLDRTKDLLSTSREANAMFNKQLSELAGIRVNTENTVTELKNAVAELKQINSNTKTSGTTARDLALSL